MKKVLLVLVVCCSTLSIFAQTPNTCCPPITKTDIINNLYQIDKTPGLMTSPYSMEFRPTTALKDKMSAYVNYLMKLCPGKAFVISYRWVKVPSIGSLPSASDYVCAEWHIWRTGLEVMFNVAWGASAYCVAGQSALAGTWFQRGDVYCLKIDMASEPGPNCFSSGCNPGLIWVKVNNPVSDPAGAGMKTKSGASSKFEIYDETGLILSK